METKMITIPFDVERAKRIQAGEEPGKIVTRNGIDARIVCWDRRNYSDPIIALHWSTYTGDENFGSYDNNGCLYNDKESDYDLVLQVPEWMQFKDGDILATKNGNCFILNANEENKTSCYAGIFFGKITFCGAANVNRIDVMTYANEEEKQQLINALKKSTDPRARKYLRRFFGFEKEEEYKFEPFDKVLVRIEDDYDWFATLFSHKGDNEDELFIAIDGIGYKYCIPYNEQTKHLLGTTDNWEVQE